MLPHLAMYCGRMLARRAAVIRAASREAGVVLPEPALRGEVVAAILRRSASGTFVRRPASGSSRSCRRRCR